MKQPDIIQSILKDSNYRIYPFNLTNLLYRASMLSVFTKGEDDADTQSQDLKPV